ncbi:ATP synthase F1 subunit epsilon [Buchnera aphidicola]|uniref:ATP synthase F1 subunit epsilon n=1 Tax=Buchnera aphidicola TaxID=9 RepID=UPI0031B83E40
MYFKLNIVSFKKKIFSNNIRSVQIPGIKGKLSIYPNHSPLLTFIKFGVIYIIKKNKKTEYIYINNGILEIQQKITNILANGSGYIKDLNLKNLINKKNLIEKTYKNIKFNNINLKIKKKYENILKKIIFFKKYKKV